MKAGRASLYADWVLRYKAKNGVLQYLLWFAFQEDFVETFCPKSKAVRATSQNGHANKVSQTMSSRGIPKLILIV
jgi:hypothetical protein